MQWGQEVFLRGFGGRISLTFSKPSFVEEAMCLVFEHSFYLN